MKLTQREMMLELHRAGGLFNQREAAAYLGVSASHFRRNLAPLLPRVYVGGQTYRYRRVDLDRWIAEHTVAPVWARHLAITAALAPELTARAVANRSERERRGEEQRQLEEADTRDALAAAALARRETRAQRRATRRRPR